jgi:hypothetical protein
MVGKAVEPEAAFFDLNSASSRSGSSPERFCVLAGFYCGSIPQVG